MKTFIRSLPGINYLIKTDTWKNFRHSLVLRLSQRKNATFTLFLRLPTQYEALAGPVLSFLLSNNESNSLKITVLGCSNGAEPYTVASVLMQKHPDLDFSIQASDIVDEMIGIARTARYQLDGEAFENEMMPPSFLANTFDIENGWYEVKASIVRRVKFTVADALDPDLVSLLGHSDIVFAQNFLFHMKPTLAKQAFKNAYLLLNTKAALFIDGMDLNMRESLTRKHNLLPLEYKIETIHNEARVGRTDPWPCNYWGLEPFKRSRKSWKRRYATIFLKT
jgi:chemotaxis protein methyltransferase CheR